MVTRFLSLSLLLALLFQFHGQSRLVYETKRFNAAGNSFVCRLINFCAFSSIKCRCRRKMLLHINWTNPLNWINVLQSSTMRFNSNGSSSTSSPICQNFVPVLLLGFVNFISFYYFYNGYCKLPMWSFTNAARFVSYGCLAKIIHDLCGHFLYLLSFSFVFVSSFFKLLENRRKKWIIFFSTLINLQLIKKLPSSRQCTFHIGGSASLWTANIC